VKVKTWLKGGSETEGRSQARLRALIVGGLLAVTAGQIYYWWGSVNDDAFISFRYSINLTRGEGLVYNAGERVEGYSNFLWVLVIAGGIELGIEPLLTAKLVSVLCLLGTLGAILRFGRGPERNLLWSGLAGLLFIGSRDVLSYSLSGMETGLHTLLITLCVFWYARHSDRAATTPWAFLWGGLGLAVLALVRLDGVLFFAALWLFHLARRLWRRQAHFLVRESLLLGLGFALLFVPYFWWRYRYYGYLLPNSYYAKTAFGLEQFQTGWSYTASFLKSYGFLAPLWVLGLTRSRNVVLGVVTLWHAGYITLVGGDWMEGYRFYAPVLPLVAVVVAEGARVLGELGRTQTGTLRQVVWASVVVAWGLALSFNARSQAGRPGGLGKYYDGGLQGLGLWLAENAPPDATLATGFAGIVPCLSQLRTLDLMGLNDVHIGHLGRGFHQNYDSHYVLRQEPDYIMLVSTTDLQKEGFVGWIGEADLYQHPDFQANYTCPLAYFSQSRGAYLWLFQRKSLGAGRKPSR